MPPGKSEPLVSPALLKQLAGILDVRERERVQQLGRSVESALRDYSIHLRLPPATAKELHSTFNKLYEQTRKLRKGFENLGIHERNEIEKAVGFIEEMPGPRAWMTWTESIAALRTILTTLGYTRAGLREPRKGRPRNTARWLFVMHLARTYARARSWTATDGRVLYELPRRDHDRIHGKDIGRFRDFVLAALAPLGDLDDGKGIDDVIRSVCGQLGKKALPD